VTKLNKEKAAMTHLTQQARYQIAHDLRLGMTNKDIALGIGCSLRQLQREFKINGGRSSYSYDKAIQSRHQRAAKSAANHRLIPETTWTVLIEGMQRRLSPDQVIHSQHLQLSVSSAYRYLHRSKLKRIRRYLRQTRIKKRRGNLSWIRKATPYKQRPKEVMTRDCIGHTETDCIVGKRKESTKIVVLLDRALRHVRLGLAKNGTANEVAKHFIQWQQDDKLPILSITTDQGSEFAGLPAIFPDNLYFCEAGKPYQKGAVENMNGLIRQYLPKGMSFDHVTQAMLDKIADELNNRPRKRLGYKSPNQLLSEITAARQFV
jgi:IS30 family transposase